MFSRSLSWRHRWISTFIFFLCAAHQNIVQGLLITWLHKKSLKILTILNNYLYMIQNHVVEEKDFLRKRGRFLTKKVTWATLNALDLQYLPEDCSQFLLCTISLEVINPSWVLWSNGKKLRCLEKGKFPQNFQVNLMQWCQFALHIRCWSRVYLQIGKTVLPCTLNCFHHLRAKSKVL